mmetsp:Transcript_17017/g.32295  ORF Transcript_17017/g.32295 Transcript_17017/m.32295 type:complete len:107 (-) Transcript_17017:655-975(-)
MAPKWTKHIAHRSGATSLYLASQNGHTDAGKVLLEHGAAVDAARRDNGLSSYEHCHLDMVQLLVENGASSQNYHKDCGSGPLMITAQNGHTNVVRSIITGSGGGRS